LIFIPSLPPYQSLVSHLLIRPIRFIRLIRTKSFFLTILTVNCELTLYTQQSPVSPLLIRLIRTKSLSE
jgi:hypothetical protein